MCWFISIDCIIREFVFQILNMLLHIPEISGKQNLTSASLRFLSHTINCSCCAIRYCSCTIRIAITFRNTLFLVNMAYLSVMLQKAYVCIVIIRFHSNYIHIVTCNLSLRLIEFHQSKRSQYCLVNLYSIVVCMFFYNFCLFFFCARTRVDYRHFLTFFDYRVSFNPCIADDHCLMILRIIGCKNISFITFIWHKYRICISFHLFISPYSLRTLQFPSSALPLACNLQLLWTGKKL